MGRLLDPLKAVWSQELSSLWLVAPRYNLLQGEYRKQAVFRVSSLQP